ncbi:TonB-dependent receptor [bacterium]|nr:MAG: TonB-dependent receptor [bacterium]
MIGDASRFIGIAGIHRTALAVIFMFLAFFSPCSSFAETSSVVSDVSISVGSRTDTFDWNIAGSTDGTRPNVLSELTWKNLEINTLKLTGRTVVDDLFYIRAYVNYGWITNGTNQDSDYNGDNRTLEFSRSNNRADSGKVWDASGGFGLKKSIALGSGTFDIKPLLGLSYHIQKLVITKGFQTIPATGAFPNLNSTYDARWFGPWLGADAAYHLGNFTLNGTAELHYAYYTAEADWNLRQDFQHPKSFEHKATGAGFVGGAGLEYAFTGNISASGNFEYQLWQAKDGTDKTFFANGATMDTKLNKVNHGSIGGSIGLKYTFN